MLARPIPILLAAGALACSASKDASRADSAAAAESASTRPEPMPTAHPVDSSSRMPVSTGEQRPEPMPNAKPGAPSRPSQPSQQPSKEPARSPSESTPDTARHGPPPPSRVIPDPVLPRRPIRDSTKP